MTSGSKKLMWIGWVVSILPAAVLIMSAVGKFTMSAADLAKGLEHVGWPERLARPLGILELCCAILFLIPQTAVLGAILVTGYMGGAVATHVRIGESWFLQVGIGVLAWLGLYLRDARVRSLIPLRTAV